MHSRRGLSEMSWSRRERLCFLENHLFWLGFIRRNDVVQRFEIGMQRASADIKEYLRLNRGALIYDRKRKLYRARRNLKPLFGKPTLETGLELLKQQPRASGPWVASVSLPVRQTNPIVAQQVFRATVQGKSLRIRYASLNSSSFRWRWISPHAFAFDGYRWHARAFCHEDKAFKDFVLGRIADTGEEGKPAARSDDDVEWTQTSRLILAPAKGMKPAEIRALELDFGLRRRRLTVPVCRALALYCLAQLGLTINGKPIPVRFRMAGLATITLGRRKVD